MSIFVTLKKVPTEDQTSYYWETVRACLSKETAMRLVAEEEERQEKLETLRKECDVVRPSWIPDSYGTVWRCGSTYYSVLGNDGRYYASQKDAELAERTRAFEAREDVKALYASFTEEESYKELEVVESELYVTAYDTEYDDNDYDTTVVAVYPTERAARKGIDDAKEAARKLDELYEREIAPFYPKGFSHSDEKDEEHAFYSPVTEKWYATAEQAEFDSRRTAFYEREDVKALQKQDTEEEYCYKVRSFL